MMDVTRMIQAAVVRADLVVCWVLALPWRRIGLSLLIAAVITHWGWHSHDVG